MKTQRVVYMNGDFVPEAEARVSIYDSALMFGDMVFEMTRSFNSRQFKLRDHMERLYAGLKILRIPLDIDMDGLESICLATCERNAPAFAPDDEHRLMINVSRGPLSIYTSVFGGQPPGCTLIVADFLPCFAKSLFCAYSICMEYSVSSQEICPSIQISSWGMKWQERSFPLNPKSGNIFFLTI